MTFWSTFILSDLQTPDGILNSCFLLQEEELDEHQRELVRTAKICSEGLYFHCLFNWIPKNWFEIQIKL